MKIMMVITMMMNMTMHTSYGDWRHQWDLAEGLERLTVNAVVATVLGSIPASSDTGGIWGAADEALLNIVHKEKKSNIK